MWKKFHVDKFFTVCSIRKILTVDGYIMNKHLERSYHLVYYQVSGEAAIACCNTVAVRSSHLSDVYLGRCGRERARFTFVAHRCVNFFYSHVKFSQLVSTAKCKIFLIYGTLLGYALIKAYTRRGCAIFMCCCHSNRKQICKKLPKPPTIWFGN